jgi:hypothetical protein
VQTTHTTGERFLYRSVERISMGMLTTVKEFLQASTESANRGDATGEQSQGTYWCHDCGERVRDVDVEGDATPGVAGDSPPDCPECGDEMDFERSPSSTGCAC